MQTLPQPVHGRKIQITLIRHEPWWNPRICMSPELGLIRSPDPSLGAQMAASKTASSSELVICSGLYFRMLLLLSITARVSFIYGLTSLHMIQQGAGCLGHGIDCSFMTSPTMTVISCLPMCDYLQLSQYKKPGWFHPNPNSPRPVRSREIS